MDKYKIFFRIVLFLSLTSLVYSIFKQSIYIYDSLLFLFFTWFFWRYHKTFNQNMLSVSMIFIAITIHNLGVFGLFSTPPYGLPYDKILHFWSGIALTYVFFLHLRTKFGFKNAIFLAVLCSLGVGVIGELNEYEGWQLFPPKTPFEGGLLDPGVGKFLHEKDYLAYVYIDTIKDLASNLAGSLITTAILSVRFLKGKRKK